MFGTRIFGTFVCSEQIYMFGKSQYIRYITSVKFTELILISEHWVPKLKFDRTYNKYNPNPNS